MLIGDSAVMQALRARVTRVARTSFTVLVVCVGAFSRRVGVPERDVVDLGGGPCRLQQGIGEVAWGRG